MTGKAAQITDTRQLFERIGYRIFLAWREAQRTGGDMGLADFYDGYNQAELRQLVKLLPGRPAARAS
jgi:hypothetical protein